MHSSNEAPVVDVRDLRMRYGAKDALAGVARCWPCLGRTARGRRPRSSLNLPRRTTRRVPRRLRQPLVAAPVLNATWALDFMGDALYDGRRIRCLTVIDEGNREVLENAVGPSLPSRRLVRVLSDLVAVHGRPTAVRATIGRNSPRSPLSTGAPSTGRLPLHPAGQAGPERLHRALQPHVSHGGPQRISSSRLPNYAR
jgi:hypothetical protein